MQALTLKRDLPSKHIISADCLKLKDGSKKTKRTPLRIGQWVFNLDHDKIGWEPLSAAVCKSGMIALFPVRKIDLTVKDNAVMHSIIGIKNMKPNTHYLLIDGTRLTGRNWRESAIDKSQKK